MPAPPKEGQTFCPTDITLLAEAFDLAMAVVGSEESPFSTIPAGELRRQVAGLILAGARHGPLAADRLAARALDNLRTMKGGIFVDRVDRPFRHIKPTET